MNSHPATLDTTTDTRSDRASDASSQDGGPGAATPTSSAADALDAGLRLRLRVRDTTDHVADVSVAARATPAEILPSIFDLLRACGVDASTPSGADGWFLRTTTGQELDGAVPLGSTDVVDGDELQLEPWLPRSVAPQVDDVAAEVAETAHRTRPPLATSTVVVATLVALAYLAAAWLVVVRYVGVEAPMASTTQLTVTASVLAAAATIGVALAARRGASAAAAVAVALPYWAVIGLLPTGVHSVSARLGWTFGILAGGAALLLLASRGRSSLALGTLVAAGLWAAATVTAAGLAGRPALAAAAVAAAGALFAPLAPWIATQATGLVAGPARAGAATLALHRVAALRGGAYAAVAGTWPLLLLDGGPATALGVVSATALVLAAVRPHAGPDATVVAVTAAAAGLTAIATATVTVTRQLGPAIGLLCPILAMTLLATGARRYPNRIATAAHRIGLLETLLYLAMPALLTTIFGGYDALYDLARSL